MGEGMKGERLDCWSIEILEGGLVENCKGIDMNAIYNHKQLCYSSCQRRFFGRCAPSE